MHAFCSYYFNTYFFCSGSFELALLRMSRYYSVSRRSVLFGDILLPMEAFLTPANTQEMVLVTQVTTLEMALVTEVTTLEMVLVKQVTTLEMVLVKQVIILEVVLVLLHRYQP